MAHFILDCDDVLLDWHSGFIAFLAARDIRVDPEGPQGWDMSEWIGCSRAAALSWIQRFNASPYFGHLSPRLGAVEFVRDIVAAGHTASVLTCCGSRPTVKMDRTRNLSEVFGARTFTHIEMLDLSACKSGALSEWARLPTMEPLIYVEDNFAHAQSGSLCGIQSYCPRRSHNRRDEAENPASGVIWIDDLREIAARHINKESAE